MPAKASCEVKTRTVRQPQKNGDIYVIERRTQYDPVKRQDLLRSPLICRSIECTVDARSFSDIVDDIHHPYLFPGRF